MSLDTIKQNAQMIGSYDLVSKIADGGMGTVYRAKHRITGELVAIKILSPHLINNTVLRRRLEQEYNAARNLDHPNIVRAVDFGIDDNTPYLVMEFVDGESLGQRIERQGPLEEVEAIRIIAQVAQGLHKAHKQGMIHRDVKPDNILLNTEGQAKLTDLGLVKEIDTDLNLTRTGRGLGTPHFMSPEQFRNAKKADFRCDIYSLGATLYMMVTGQLPFKSCGPVDAWMKKINNDLPTPRDLVPVLSERIDWAIRRAMNPDPQHRPTTCREFIEDLTGHSTRKTGDASLEDLWYLYYKDDRGVVHTVKGALAGMRHNLKEGNLGDIHSVRVARTKAGPFEPLRQVAEFRDLVFEPPPVSSIGYTPVPHTTNFHTPVTDSTGIMVRKPKTTMIAKPQMAPPSLAVLSTTTVQKEMEEAAESFKAVILIIVALLTGILGYFLVPILSQLRLL
jgi:serine/threonine protein kinase